MPVILWKPGKTFFLYLNSVQYKKNKLLKNPCLQKTWKNKKILSFEFFSLYLQNLKSKPLELKIEFFYKQ